MPALLLFISILLPSLAHLKIVCPDATECAESTQCCSASPTSFGCCEVRQHLIEEMEVAGREHLLGMPSEFGRRVLLGDFCGGSKCGGRGFCCSHRNAQCCRLPHQCCKFGYKCCGGGSSWCCPWKLACSAAYGYCISRGGGMKEGWLLVEGMMAVVLLVRRGWF